MMDGLPPAERIRMQQLRLHDQPPLRLQHLDNLLIRRLDIHPRKLGHLRRELARVVDGAGRHLVRLEHAAGDRDAVIVVAECGCLVDDARTGVGGDVFVDDDAEGFVFELSMCVGITTKQYEYLWKIFNSPVQ